MSVFSPNGGCLLLPVTITQKARTFVIIIRSAFVSSSDTLMVLSVDTVQIIFFEGLKFGDANYYFVAESL